MNDDLISREALRAQYQAILDRGDMFCEYDIIGMVDNAPTVESQKIVTIPPELIEKLASCVVDIVGNIDWDKAIEAYEERPHGEIIKELWNCRNELCLRCGKYEKAYCGACDDCRYNSDNMKRWRKDSE